MKRVEEFEKKIDKIIKENQDSKKKIAGLKKEISVLKKELKHKNIVHNNIPAGIVLIRDRIILTANDTFLEMIGREYGDIVNSYYLDYIDPSDLIDVRKRHKKWNTEKVKRDRYDARFITKAGGSVLCSVESKRARYRGRASYVLNITELEEREKDQDAKIKEIRTDTVINLLKGFREEKKQNAAAIKEIIKLIEKGKNTFDIKPEQFISRLEALEKIFQKQEYMLRLIIDDSGYNINKRRFNINTIIQDALSSTLNPVNKTENEITVHTYFRSSSILEGDPDDFKDAFAHILLCLIENMPEGGELHITTEESSGFSCIYIQDNNTGKGKYPGESLFYPYWETNSPGMAYSRAVIKSHNGTLEVINGNGEGLIFQVMIPLAPKVTAKKKLKKSRLKKSRILIIQDDDVVRELMSHLLMEKGCRLDTSKTFLEGLAKIKKNKIDMVIADTDSIEMDINNFFKKCRALKPEMLTVLIGDRKSESGIKNDSKAPDIFILKPIEINSVVKKVSRLLMTEY